MNTGRTVFSQIMDFLPLREFRKCVARYHGNYKIQKFSCMDQFLCMAFAQLTYRESLRDIEACLRAMQSKLYHMGIRSRISRSTLADANENRDWRIYGDFAQVLIHVASDNNRTALQMPLAGGAVLQMDQTAPAYQSLFWHIRERREDSSVDCNLGLCVGGDNQKGIESGFESLHNSTDSERDFIRESVYFTGTYGSWLQN